MQALVRGITTIFDVNRSVRQQGRLHNEDDHYQSLGSHSDDCDPYVALLIKYYDVIARFEKSKIMIQLASEYFEFRAFWFSYVPLLLVTTLVSLCSFLITGEVEDVSTTISNQNSPKTVSFSEVGNEVSGGLSTSVHNAVIGKDNKPFLEEKVLSIVLVVLGFLSALFTSLGRYLGYQSRSDLHGSASATLQEICDTIDFEQFPHHHRKGLGFKISQSEIEDLETKISRHCAIFDVIEKLCGALIPKKIKHAFDRLEEIFEPLPYQVKLSLYRRYHYALWREFCERRYYYCSCLRMFPCFVPNIDVDEVFGNRIKAETEALLMHDERDSQLEIEARTEEQKDKTTEGSGCESLASDLNLLLFEDFPEKRTERTYDSDDSSERMRLVV